MVFLFYNGTVEEGQEAFKAFLDLGKHYQEPSLRLEVEVIFFPLTTRSGRKYRSRTTLLESQRIFGELTFLFK